MHSGYNVLPYLNFMHVWVSEGEITTYQILTHLFLLV